MSNKKIKHTDVKPISKAHLKSILGGSNVIAAWPKKYEGPPIK
ncbi:MAG: hypothetical protein AAFQ94_20930 [Bacteroidota bacterium]